MTRHQKQEYADIVEEMRRLGRSQFESSEELQQLRDQAAAERIETQQSILEAIAEQAHVDLRPILEGARDAQLERRRQIAEVLTRLEAEAGRRANQEKERFHRTRREYRDAFEGQLAGPSGTTQLKFREVISSRGEAIPAKCTHLEWHLFSPSIGGDFIATADIVTGTDTPGTWLHPKIDIYTRDCDRVPESRTFQELTYRMDTPATSFGVENIRVDLIANGIFSSHLGDPGIILAADPLYYHTHVKLDVYIAQQLAGEWHIWPLVSDELFTARGNVDGRQIRSVLSGQTVPINLFIRGADTGGGELLCMVQVTCSNQSTGSGARALLDFSAAEGYGIFVGGVALIGAFA